MFNSKSKFKIQLNMTKFTVQTYENAAAASPFFILSAIFLSVFNSPSPILTSVICKLRMSYSVSLQLALRLEFFSPNICLGKLQVSSAIFVNHSAEEISKHVPAFSRFVKCAHACMHTGAHLADLVSSVSFPKTQISF